MMKCTNMLHENRGFIYTILRLPLWEKNADSPIVHNQVVATKENTLEHIALGESCRMQTIVGLIL